MNLSWVKFERKELNSLRTKIFKETIALKFMAYQEARVVLGYRSNNRTSQQLVPNGKIGIKTYMLSSIESTWPDFELAISFFRSASKRVPYPNAKISCTAKIKCFSITCSKHYRTHGLNYGGKKGQKKSWSPQQTEVSFARLPLSSCRISSQENSSMSTTPGSSWNQVNTFPGDETSSLLNAGDSGTPFSHS
jgi:hypothetical protein